ncbi:MAG: hypothetical protein FWD35_00555 [Oscillospiraceae bacterium]|nr:hypothetical protein [Oscillospiraceae bacterium]
MRTKQDIIEAIEFLPPELLDEIYRYAAYIKEQKEAENEYNAYVCRELAKTENDIAEGKVTWLTVEEFFDIGEVRNV